MEWKKFRHSSSKKPQAGQAMIEFVLGLMLIISFFFFYVKMAAVFAVGNYIHYATFMAARAYSSSDDSQDKQVENAEEVLRATVAGRWKTLIKPGEGNSTVKGASVGPGNFFNDNPAADQWNQGVTFSFKTKLALYPWSRDGQSILLDLTSESWMHREETTTECLETKAEVMSRVKANGKAATVEWDNGC